MTLVLLCLCLRLRRFQGEITSAISAFVLAVLMKTKLQWKTLFLIHSNQTWRFTQGVWLFFKVKYDATNFLEKNRDTLSPDIIQVLRSSGKESALMNE